ncbi:MAG: class I SAM-dependent methyltransferase [Acidobacteria bacterium]|nr:class I SAM-dependent methyltransferase [Acidobacteriota bacterium]
MTRNENLSGALAACLLLAALLAPGVPAQKGARRKRAPPPPPHKSDVIFVPTPPETVEEMLRLAELKEGDVLYDLGSGDGRIPIRAAEKYGVRAVGIEIDPELVAASERAARAAGVAERVRFRRENLFRADFREATVVTLYLSETINVALRPRLLRELKPGTKIISHDFRMGGWEPEQWVKVPWRNLHRNVYVWTVPPRGRIKQSVPARRKS